jgi:GTPase
LLELIDRELETGARILRLDIPLTDGKTLAWLYRRGEVLGRRDDNEAAHLSVRLSEEDIARLRHRQRLH